MLQIEHYDDFAIMAWRGGMQLIKFQPYPQWLVGRNHTLEARGIGIAIFAWQCPAVAALAGDGDAIISRFQAPLFAIVGLEGAIAGDGHHDSIGAGTEIRVSGEDDPAVGEQIVAVVNLAGDSDRRGIRFKHFDVATTCAKEQDY